ncbi:MAG: hypothetical protein AAFY08_16545, partial [Planctomycetota bacterium]
MEHAMAAAGRLAAHPRTRAAGARAAAAALAGFLAAALAFALVGWVAGAAAPRASSAARELRLDYRGTVRAPAL